MNKWTWIVLLAIALLGGGYYLSSYQKSKDAAPVSPLGKDPAGEDFDGGEDSGELDRDGSGFEGSEGQDPGAADDASQGLGGSQDGPSAADTETFEDQDDPNAAPKDGSHSRETLNPAPLPNQPK